MISLCRCWTVVQKLIEKYIYENIRFHIYEILGVSKTHRNDSLVSSVDCLDNCVSFRKSPVAKMLIPDAYKEVPWDHTGSPEERGWVRGSDSAKCWESPENVTARNCLSRFKNVILLTSPVSNLRHSFIADSRYLCIVLNSDLYSTSLIWAQIFYLFGSFCSGFKMLAPSQWS